MRRSLIALSMAALLAACAGNPPAETPILPWSPPDTTAVPGDASAAPASPDLTCQPGMPTDDPADWVDLAPAGAGFSIKMPGQVAENTAKITTPVGDVPMTIWAYPDGCSRILMVAHLTFAAGALSKAGSVNQVLDQAVAAQLQNEKGAAITSQSDVTVDGKPGRRFTISGGASVTQGIVVLAVDDIYMAVASSDARHPLPAASLEAFFSSFALTV